MTYKCDHFRLHELVPPAVLKDRGEKAWELLDERALITLDLLREKFGKMTINDYQWGGDREWSGLRTPDSPYGTLYSQHRFGRAFDCIFNNLTAEEVREAILDNPYEDTYFRIGSIELGVSWLHFDTRNCDRIKTYYP